MRRYQLAVDLSQHPLAIRHAPRFQVAGYFISSNARRTPTAAPAAPQCDDRAWVHAGGERILDVFELKLKDSIQKLPFQKILTLKNVQNVVNEADGYQPHIIAPENGYRCAAVEVNNRHFSRRKVQSAD